ncbi:response regulator [Natronomonas sp. EA1]|uniref:response regulator n=1 Tax=Natronomonas sp. EA1 TaxID=3421655 RepID=UPI003EB6BAF9
MNQGISVLVVDDDAGLRRLVADVLSRAPDIDATTAADVATALDDLTHGDPGYDCVISDYEMPERDGLDLLRRVRERWPHLPFILFTGRGSEEIAADAIAAGVTDYLQKETGTAQYTVLLHRIRNAVGQARAEEESRLRARAMEAAREGIAVLDAEGYYRLVNEAFAAPFGLDTSEMVGQHWETYNTPEEVSRLREEVFESVEKTGAWEGHSTALRPDGTVFEEHASLTKLPGGGFVCCCHVVGEPANCHADTPAQAD